MELWKSDKSEYDLRYRTNCSVAQCVEQILAQPWSYSDPLWCLGELWYRCEQLGEDTIHIAFTGGQFRKMARTEYRMTFLPESAGTGIVLRYEAELGEGLFRRALNAQVPPMTLAQAIDRFMQEKLSAVRVRD